MISITRKGKFIKLACKLQFLDGKSWNFQFYPDLFFMLLTFGKKIKVRIFTFQFAVIPKIDPGLFKNDITENGERLAI